MECLIPVVQEPGTSEEIKKFAQSFNVHFDMFEKVEVNGNNAHPVWVFLKAKQGGGLLGMVRISRHEIFWAAALPPLSTLRSSFVTVPLL
jgi:glutathione peroxidase-family protein